MKYDISRQFDYRGKDLKNVTLKIFSLMSETEREKGMLELKKISDSGEATCRVISGGGDGTVMWVLQEMHKYGIS